MGKPILCLDFDGVIHKYDTKWEAAHIIADGPVEGALEFIDEALNYFDVAIYSSRSHQEGGKEAMKQWLLANLEQKFNPAYARDMVNEIKWPEEKPPAFLTIDDRAMCFTGTFPDPAFLKEFKPWNKQ